MSLDLGAMYRSARLRIGALVDDDVATVAVPATPLWDVHEVVAHLAGVAEDAVTGNLDGVTTDPWTAAQVERGRGRTIAELVARWNEHGPFVEAFLSSPDGASASRAVIDVHTHECDLLGALGRLVELPEDAVAWIGGALRDDFASAIAAAGLPPVTVDADDLEVLRSRLGRRTGDEVRAYGWSADPGPYLDHWFVFGVAERSLGERRAG